MVNCPFDDKPFECICCKRHGVEGELLRGELTLAYRFRDRVGEHLQEVMDRVENLKRREARNQAALKQP